MNTWKCPKCKKKTPTDRQFCQHCLYNVARHYSAYKITSIGTNGAAQKRQWDKNKHAKDIIQPFMKNKPNPDFIKAYKDDDELLDNYYTKDELRKNE